MINRSNYVLISSMILKGTPREKPECFRICAMKGDNLFKFI